MKYKTPKEKARKIFYCDNFSGLNSADDLLSLSESQLSECVNLWNPNGVLSSRPGLKNSVIALQKNADSIENKMYEADINPVTLNGFSKIFAISEQYVDSVKFRAFLTNKDNYVQKVADMEIQKTAPYSYVELKNAVIINDTTVCESGVVLVLAICEHLNGGIQKRVEFYELLQNYFVWERINKEKFYTPTILINGRGNLFEAAYDPEGLDTIKPLHLEDFNIVNGRFKAYFRTDGFSNTFELPVKDLSYKEEDKFYIQYNHGGEIINFKLTWLNESDTQNIGDKKITCHLNRKEGIISFTEGVTPYYLPISGVVLNGLCVEGAKDVHEQDFDLFGGKTQSILADARLLRSSAENNSNKIYYSGKENYFYFCESNYFEVGGNSEPITAMAFQNRYLFAFKDNSIYRLKLSDTAGYDIEKIIRDSKKMPNTALSVTITKVHNAIGCDCPESVKFCQNRLVWYHSSGAVYTLYGTNTYTEGSIYTLSPNIKNMLDIPYEDITSISACVKDGYYFLTYKNKIFVMDGNVSGFTYLSGSVQKDGGGGLNWFYWELPANIRLKCLYSLSRELFAVYEGNRADSTISVSGFGGEEDEIIIDAETSGVVNIKVTFASALFGTKIKEKKTLIKASMLLKALHNVSFWVFSEDDSGKEIKTTQNGTLKRQNLLSSGKNTFGAGIKMTAIAPIVISDIAFEYELH